MALDSKKLKSGTGRKGDASTFVPDVEANSNVFPELPSGIPDINALLIGNIFIQSFERDALYPIIECKVRAEVLSDVASTDLQNAAVHTKSGYSDADDGNATLLNVHQGCTHDAACWSELCDGRLVTQRLRPMMTLSALKCSRPSRQEYGVILDHRSNSADATVSVATAFPKLFPQHDMLVRDAEQGVATELCCESIVRSIVREAASLYAARCLDRVKEGYTACSVWAEVRDGVAAAFLPLDVGAICRQHLLVVSQMNGARVSTMTLTCGNTNKLLAQPAVAPDVEFKKLSNNFSAVVEAGNPLRKPPNCYDSDYLAHNVPCTLLMSAAQQLRADEDGCSRCSAKATLTVPPCPFMSFTAETSRAIAAQSSIISPGDMTVTSMEPTPGASPAHVPVDDYCRYLVQASERCDAAQGGEACGARTPKLSTKAAPQRAAPHGPVQNGSVGGVFAQNNGTSPSVLDVHGATAQRTEEPAVTSTALNGRSDKGHTQRASAEQRLVYQRLLAARDRAPRDGAAMADTAAVTILKPTARERAARLVVSDDLSCALGQVPPSYLSAGIASGSANNAAHVLAPGRPGMAMVTVLHSSAPPASVGEMAGGGTQPALSRTQSTAGSAIAQRHEPVYNLRRDGDARVAYLGGGVVDIADSHVVPQRSARLERARAMQRRSAASGRRTIVAAHATEDDASYGLTFRVQHGRDVVSTPGAESVMTSEGRQQHAEHMPCPEEKTVVTKPNFEQRATRARSDGRRGVTPGRVGVAQRRPHAERKAKLDELTPHSNEQLFVLPLLHASETETLAKQLNLQPKPGVVLQQSTLSSIAGATTIQRSTNDLVRPVPRGRRDERAVVADGGAFVIPLDKQRWAEYKPVTEVAVGLTVPSIVKGAVSTAATDRQGTSESV